jgi:hypothetical protein
MYKGLLAQPAGGIYGIVEQHQPEIHLLLCSENFLLLIKLLCA